MTTISSTSSSGLSGETGSSAKTSIAAPGLGGQGGVDRQEVRRRQAGLELDEIGTQPVGSLLADVRVVREQRHPEPVEPPCDLLAHAAQPHDPEGLVVELGAEVVGFGPLARLQPSVGLRDRPRGGERHPDGVLGGRPDVALGGVRHDDAVVGRGVDVDVVDADPRTPHDDQVRGGLEHRLGDLGSGADDQGVRVRDRFEQRVASQVVGRLDVVTRLAEPFDPRVVDRVGNNHLHM